MTYYIMALPIIQRNILRLFKHYMLWMHTIIYAQINYNTYTITILTQFITNKVTLYAVVVYV